jgi:hypothetical protein
LRSFLKKKARIGPILFPREIPETDRAGHLYVKHFYACPSRRSKVGFAIEIGDELLECGDLAGEHLLRNIVLNSSLADWLSNHEA